MTTTPESLSSLRDWISPGLTKTIIYTIDPMESAVKRQPSVNYTKKIFVWNVNLITPLILKVISVILNTIFKQHLFMIIALMLVI